MTSVEAVLTGSLAKSRLTLQEAFQGLPKVAHGGIVLAAFDIVAAPPNAPRQIVGIFRRKVPLRVSLPLTVHRLDRGAELRLSDQTHGLVEGRVGPAEASSERLTLPPRPGDGFPLPISNSCFACGVQNPLGLQMSLRFDEHLVWTEYRPREPFRAADGRLATAALTTLLDETAFWLGALATGESGVTTELRITLHRPAYPFGESLIALGLRDRVTPAPGDRRYWRTESFVVSLAGELIASGVVSFVAIRGAARRLITGVLGINPPEVLRRIFPTY
ncbi:MAG: hypothetical protein ACE5JD_16465 [Candidatus Methylomirabilia bacterium]